jgi:hypothetical protein
MSAPKDNNFDFYLCSVCGFVELKVAHEARYWNCFCVRCRTERLWEGPFSTLEFTLSGRKKVKESAP